MGSQHEQQLQAPAAAKPRSWLDNIPKSVHTKHFLEADFASTALGSLESWGAALRLYASMVFADSRAACVYWGPNKVAFYNEKFAESVQGKHPYLMSHGFGEAFPELADLMQPMFDGAFATGETADVKNMQLFVYRNGFLEETYFVGQFIPIRGDSGDFEGLYNTLVESTSETLSERRRRVADQITALPSIGVDETWQAILQTLRTNPYDVPFAALYSYTDSLEDVQADLRLRGSIGAPQGHQCLPSNLDSRLVRKASSPSFAR